MKKTLLILLFAISAVFFVFLLRRSPALPVPAPTIGADDDRVWVSTLPPEKATMVVNAFFLNKKKDPNVLDCEKMYPVTRHIAKTSSVARAALEQLLMGPTAEEMRDGYFTNINDGVKIQKLSIANGIARVDFDQRLREYVGGSCKVLAIRAHITETLKQFPSVQQVVISVNGQTENILEP